jgi:hypothetical protein
VTDEPQPPLEEDRVASDLETIAYATKFVNAFTAKGMQNGQIPRLILDMTRRLARAAVKDARSDILIRKFYRLEKGVTPLNYRSWVEIRDRGLFLSDEMVNSTSVEGERG